ncbi:peptidoglycan-recognition protein SC2-like [Ixodes scapularis]
MLSFVLLVSEWTAGEGASATSAEVTRRVRTQRAHSPPGIVQSNHHSNRNSIEHNAVNWESGKCAEIMLVRRKDWGARESKNVDYLRTNGGVTIVFYHHTEGLECNSVETCAKIIRQWQDYHMDTKRWDDIAYNFVIGGDGRVYEGRGFDGIGAHTLSYNSKSVSLAFVGNFTFNVPNSKMLAAAGVLIECGVKSVLSALDDPRAFAKEATEPTCHCTGTQIAGTQPKAKVPPEARGAKRDTWATLPFASKCCTGLVHWHFDTT